MVIYVRAEQGGDWALRLCTVSKMLRSLFSSEHHCDATCVTYYLNDIGNHHLQQKKKFFKSLQQDIKRDVWTPLALPETLQTMPKSLVFLPATSKRSSCLREPTVLVRVIK